MQTFCPYCANSLTVVRKPPTDQQPLGLNHMACRTCPYSFPIDARYYDRTYMKRKEVDDVLEEVAIGGDIADVRCPKEGCENAQASYTQKQLRSADEPMTIFYTCTECGNRWREG